MREGATVAIADINLEAAEKAAKRDRRHGLCRPAGCHQPGLDRRRHQGRRGEGRRARHPGQQCRAVRHGADRRDHPRELRQAVLGQRRRHAVHPAGGGQVDDRADGKGGKIINMASQAGRRGEALVGGLLRHQGGGHHADPVRPASTSSSTGINVNAHRARRGRRRALGPCRRAVRQVREPASSARRSSWSARPCRSAAWGRRPTWRRMAIFLATSDSDYIVAQTYNVDGGNWMS